MRKGAVLAIAMIASFASAALVSGCSSSSDTTTTGAITWRPCGSIQCATLSVPLDYSKPNGAHINLALARKPASGHAAGVLFANPGGPGASGVMFLRSAGALFEPPITKSFDIISWDPRGVGASAPIRCVDELDPFYAVDRDPSTPAQVAANVSAARSFVASCKQRSGSELAHVSSGDSARDMDSIRAAMGVDKISYFGFSYGTYLGALYAQQYPTHLRAAVLDGAIDPSLSYEATTITQAEGFENELDAFFSWCKATPTCDFARGSDPRAAYDSLERDLTSESIPATVHGERRTLGPGEFDVGVASALYAGESGFDDLADALVQTAQGNGEKILQFADTYTERHPGGTYSNETAALYAVSCLDAPAPGTVAAVAQIAARAERAAPHFGATTTWLALPCTFWPAPPSGKVAPVRAPQAPPILVVGTRNDPATPYSWAQSLARQLGVGHLLTFDGYGHTAYGRGSTCIDDAVNQYVVALTLPAGGTTCT